MGRGDLSDAEWEPISPLLQSNGGALGATCCRQPAFSQRHSSCAAGGRPLVDVQPPARRGSEVARRSGELKQSHLSLPINR